MKNVLLIGATGVFGQRLAHHLAAFESIHLTLTSRDIKKADALAKKIKATGPNAPIDAVALDTKKGLSQQLAILKPWLVIDASGPFQSADYSVPDAVLDAGAHYLDLADAREYLKGFVQMDFKAKAAGLVALAGASSTPALSSAVIAALTKDWARIDCVDIAIVPGGKSDVGPAVINAILTYVGKPVPSLSKGVYGTITAWVNSQIIDVPGLGKRRIAPVETADVDLVAPHYKVQQRLLFQAGLESPIEQWGIIMLSHLKRLGLPGKLTGLTPLLQVARKLTRIFTGDKGAMIITASGLDTDGKPVSAEWLLIAKNGDGPNVPVMAAAAAVRTLLNNEIEAGARACINVLPLPAIENEMKDYQIETSIRITPSQ
jgi:NAD(P)-dependent dehydrogenase (short-subunit alcohol dehydrogenase family)